MRLRRLEKVWLWHLVGPVVVVAAIWWAGPTKVWAVLSNASLRLVVIAIALSIPLAIIKGIRWQILLRNYDIELTFCDSMSMYATGMVLSAVTPGRIGDMVKIVMLINKGCGIGKAIASNIFDRLFDVAFVLLAGYGGMWYFSQNFTSQLQIVNIIFVIVLVLLVVLVLKRQLMKKLAIKLVPSQYRSTAIESWNEIISGLLKKRSRRIFWLILWTIVFWLVQFSAIYLCGLALEVDVSFIYLSACAAVAMILSLLPITVAGVGTRDAIYILLLGQVGIAQQQSLALSSLVLVVFLINCVVFYLISVIFKSNLILCREHNRGSSLTGQS
jgi:uncharacterized protein (TIRG00374 family)